MIMAHFRGTARGGTTTASRLGHKTTGMVTECNGWDSGIRAEASFRAGIGDCIIVYATGGSNSSRGVRLGSLQPDPDGNLIWTPNKDAEGVL